MSCWKDEWPHLPVCDDIMGRTPAEKVQRLQERLAQNPGDSAGPGGAGGLGPPARGAPAGLDAPALAGRCRARGAARRAAC